MRLEKFAKIGLIIAAIPTPVHADCLQAYQNEISRLEKSLDQQDAMNAATFNGQEEHPVKRALISGALTEGTFTGVGSIGGPVGAMAGAIVGVAPALTVAYNVYEDAKAGNNQLASSLDHSKDDNAYQLADRQEALGLLQAANSGTIPGNLSADLKKNHRALWIETQNLTGNQFLSALSRQNSLNAFCSPGLATTDDLLQAAVRMGSWLPESAPVQQQAITTQSSKATDVRTGSANADEPHGDVAN